MFENYKEMSAEEQAQVKAIHKAIRATTSDRYGNLAWAFVRGMPYRRVERTTRTQTMGDGSIVEHNKPYAHALTHAIATHVPGFAPKAASAWQTKAHPAVEAWLADPSGAIAAPSPHPKLARPAREGEAAE
ncbi:MAG: hypothetical protein ACHREM_00465 [Polyangiales bacterium]